MRFISAREQPEEAGILPNLTHIMSSSGQASNAVTNQMTSTKVTMSNNSMLGRHCHKLRVFSHFSIDPAPIIDTIFN